MAYVNEQSDNPTTPQSQAHRINKSLLTPCRRVGLKRKSPSISPSCTFASGRNLSSPIESGRSVELMAKANCQTPSSLKSGETPKRNVTTTETSKRGQWPQKTITSNKGQRVKRRETQAQLDGTAENETAKTEVDTFSLKSALTGNTDSENILEGGHETVYDKETLEDLQKKVAAKEDKVHSLKVAQLYRKKHDLTTLRESICRWKAGCQTALQDLLVLTREKGHQITMLQLLSHLGIPHDLIGYDPEQDEFT